MKNYLFISVAGVIVLISFLSLNQQKVGLPEEVQEIVGASCMACHNTDSKNKDAKKELDFLKWEDYKVTKKISLLSEICELCEEGEMPPGKFIDRFPEKKLREEQIKTICEWTAKETEKLMTP